MPDHFTVKLKPAAIADLYDITLKSSVAASKEVFIFEKSDLSAFFSIEEAENIRANFLSHSIQVKQISNTPIIPKFSSNDQFINQVMRFRYVPASTYEITNEVLIFDDSVAVYNESELMVIKDKNFAHNHKQLFNTVWDLGDCPKLEFDYKPNHSFYKNLNFFLDGKQIIVWPDADAKISYHDMNINELESYILGIVGADADFACASYAIVFMWSFEGHKMLDVWLFSGNYVDDRSGPLSDVKVYKDGEIVRNLGTASGNTLLVLGYEEKLRRQSNTLNSYLSGPPPQLPLEIVNGKDFFAD